MRKLKQIKLSSRSLSVLSEVEEKERKGPTGAALKKSKQKTAERLKRDGLLVTWDTPSGIRWFITSAAERVLEER